MKLFIFICTLHLLFPPVAYSQPKTDPWLETLLHSKASPFLKDVLSKPDTFQYQIIYTKIDRDKKNQPRFTHYHLNVDCNRYFNPASTVKLPTALAAIEKLNKLEIKGVRKYTTMLTDSAYGGQTFVKTDTSSASGLPTIAHYIKKLFLVSDNDAYNRLYEFTGQQILNETLRQKGYPDIRITRRFVPMNQDQNRYTNPVRFVKDDRLVYSQPKAYSDFIFDFSRRFLVGRAHLNARDSLIHSPMDFTTHNNLPLEDLQSILQSVIFPLSVPRQQRFQLTKDDLRFLYYYMSALPSESRFPTYDTVKYFDSYTKFFFKAGQRKPPPHIRIINKTGWSYGFLTDAAYVVDFNNNIEFMLSAVIYVNADGVLNDNKYEYEQTGYPFFSEIYSILYEYELIRERQHSPKLGKIKNMLLAPPHEEGSK